MYTIMLVCSAGMSTSMLVTKMNKAAEKNQLSVTIFAQPASKAEELFEQTKIDLVLLGPQVKFLEQEFKKKCDNRGIKMDVINMMDYGMMNGEKVLKDALKMLS